MNLMRRRRPLGIAAAMGLLATASGCSATGKTEVTGTILGTELNVHTAYWGGPFIALTDADVSCQDMAWVERVYEKGVAPVDYDMVTMQVTFGGSQVGVGTFDVTAGTGGTAVSVKWLTTVGGTFDEAKARTGYVQVDEITGKDRAVGSFDLSFDNGSIEGSFDVPTCTNLKDH